MRKENKTGDGVGFCVQSLGGKTGRSALGWLGAQPAPLGEAWPRHTTLLAPSRSLGAGAATHLGITVHEPGFLL